MIRVLIVDDHAVFRDATAYLLGLQPDMTVAAQAGSVAEVLRLEDEVDVALVDLQLPDRSGTEVISHLRRHNPAAVAVVLTGSADPVEHARAIEAGASAVMLKTTSFESLLAAIRRAAAGEPIQDPRELIGLLQLTARRRARDAEMQHRLAQLTPRERDLLQALADGLSDKEIAARLFLSVRTVQGHMANLLDKLGVDSRLQALVVAVRHGVVSIKVV